MRAGEKRRRTEEQGQEEKRNVYVLLCIVYCVLRNAYCVLKMHTNVLNISPPYFSPSFLPSLDSSIHSFMISKGSRENEFWQIGKEGTTIKSEQPNTPFCVGVKTVNGKVQIGSSTVLNDCVGTDSSTFTIGFTNTAATGGTIVRE